MTFADNNGFQQSRITALPGADPTGIQNRQDQLRPGKFRQPQFIPDPQPQEQPDPTQYIPPDIQQTMLMAGMMPTANLPQPDPLTEQQFNELLNQNSTEAFEPMNLLAELSQVMGQMQMPSFSQLPSPQHFPSPKDFQAAQDKIAQAESERNQLALESQSLKAELLSLHEIAEQIQQKHEALSHDYLQLRESAIKTQKERDSLRIEVENREKELISLNDELHDLEQKSSTPKRLFSLGILLSVLGLGIWGTIQITGAIDGVQAQIKAGQLK